MELLKKQLFGELDLIVEAVNDYHSGINKELKRLNCTEDVMYMQPITADIDRVKSMLNKMTDEEIRIIQHLINHVTTYTEIINLSDKELDERIKGFAELSSEMGVATLEID